MYGVPQDLDLSIFVGKPLTLVGIGEFQVYFHFHPEGIVTVEGDWDVLGPDGTSGVRQLQAVRVVLDPARGHSCVGDCPRSSSLATASRSTAAKGTRCRTVGYSTE
jgi:hypothetical protein